MQNTLVTVKPNVKLICDLLSNATHLDCQIPILTFVSQKSLGCLLEYSLELYRSLDQNGWKPHIW